MGPGTDLTAPQAFAVKSMIDGLRQRSFGRAGRRIDPVPDGSSLHDGGDRYIFPLPYPCGRCRGLFRALSDRISFPAEKKVGPSWPRVFSVERVSRGSFLPSGRSLPWDER